MWKFFCYKADKRTSYQKIGKYDWALITHANDSRGSKAFISICLRLSVFCLHDKTKRAETTIIKLATGI